MSYLEEDEILEPHGGSNIIVFKTLLEGHLHVIF